jgi:hypothetical protein
MLLHLTNRRKRYVLQQLHREDLYVRQGMDLR